MSWQPIETAPAESEVLAWFGPRVGVKSATYTDKDSDGVMFWCVTDGKFGPHPVRGYLSPYPTHWMPLPEPPEGSKPCRADGRCQYAVDHGAEGLGACQTGKCVMAQGSKP